VREANSITLRAAMDEDERFLYELYAGTRRSEMAMVPWPPEQKHAFLRMQFEAQIKHYRSAYPNADHSIVVTGEALAGRLYAHREESQILIVDLTLLPEFRGRGIGRALVSELQREAVSLRKVLTGHVERWNPASAFWRHMGFEIADGDDVYNRIVWSLAASSQPA
jgi:GNAT superfamily N-acetyltransferase